ncbi:MAG TPA: hypothetical protein VEL74_08825 [Thermoanaerobaculia bacterium]|nr:hypothetical protein [Thermoanaerobaculia bacterium]
MPMHAHKLKVNVPPDHQIEIHLPEDFPQGPAEVIVLASVAERRSGAREAGIRSLEPHPLLGKIIFHEDPSLPLDAEDWPEE